MNFRLNERKQLLKKVKTLNFYNILIMQYSCTEIEQLSEEIAQLIHNIEQLELQLKNMEEVDTILPRSTVSHCTISFFNAIFV